MVGSLIPLQYATPAWSACPIPYNDDDCDVLGENICEITGQTIECDLDRSHPTSGGVAALGIAVYNAADGACGTGYEYCIFGVDTNNQEFCCEINAVDEEELQLKGTPEFDDELYFHVTIDNSTFTLSNWNPGSIPYFTGRAFGRGGADYIEGSYDPGVYYRDTLHGDIGDDTILGLAGDDLITGDIGIDTIYGGDDDDVIRGKTENDYLFGGAGDDSIAGGAEDDVIDGGDGSDLICGDDDQDDMDGGGGNDILWGGAGTDDIGAGGGQSSAPGDTCDSGTTESISGCEATFSFSRPSGCPVP